MAQEKKCKEKGCKRPYRAKGYCNVHYRLWRQGKLSKARYWTCNQEGCLKKVFQKMLCEEHYQAIWGVKPAAEQAIEAAPAPAPEATETPNPAS